MKQLCILIILLIMGVSAHADDSIEVKTLLKGKLDDVISILQDKTLDDEARNLKLIASVEPMFDFFLMAKLSLGKEHWSSLSGEERKRFTDLFVSKLKYSYIDKLKRYTDETVIYHDTIRKSGSKVHVSTDLMSNGNAYSMLYKFYRSDTGWKIYDIEIQEVSIISSYRSQCNHILKNGTFDDLIAVLQKSSTL